MIDSKKYLKEVLSADEKNEKAVITLANIFVEMGDHQNSITCLRKAIEVNPENTILLHYLGLCLIQNREFKEGFR